MIKSNERIILKRSDVSGAIPISAISYDHSDNTWDSYMCYPGEIFINLTDNKMWWMGLNGPNLVYYSGQTLQFVDLTDAPSSYIGYSNFFLKVNSGETGLEYVEITGVTNSTQLYDMPNSYSGYAGYNLTVNSAETGYELTQNTSTFLGLTDTPTGYTGFANYVVIVNSDETGLTYADTSNIVTTNNIQIITAAKTFTNYTYFNQYATFNSGITIGAIKITEFATDFTSPSNSQLPTTQAVYDYITEVVTSGVTLSGVAYLESGNTFTEKNNFTDIQVGSTNNIFIGDSETNGSFKLAINGDGALQISKLISGSWVLVNTFDVI